MYFTDGWTSSAGNTYNRGFRVSDKLLLAFSIGQGYCRTFINGISVYVYDGVSARLVGSKSYNCTFFSNSFVDSECKQIVIDYIKGQQRIIGASLSDSQAGLMAEELVKRTYNRLLN